MTIEATAPYVDSRPWVPTYQPIRSFPALKSIAVNRAPGQTSCHWMLVSGNHLNIKANSAVRIASETTKLTTSSAIAFSEDRPNWLVMAARTVLTTSEIASRKPSARVPDTDTN